MGSAILENDAIEINEMLDAVGDLIGYACDTRTRKAVPDQDDVIELFCLDVMMMSAVNVSNVMCFDIKCLRSPRPVWVGVVCTENLNPYIMVMKSAKDRV